MEHVIIYREEGRYAGWPANYGIWSWDDEVVVGFTVGYHDPGGGFHTRDRSRPFVPMQARSRDGGRSWEVSKMPCRVPGDRGLSADEHLTDRHAVGEALAGEQLPQGHPEGVDFTGPDFALMCARSGLRAGARSWFYTSTDRCRSWEGPYLLPTFGLPGVAARTDYLISGPRECLLFLTAAKSDGEEGRSFCARTSDGGRTFRFRSWIGPEPEGFAIMPASVRLPAGRILVAIRRRGAGNRRGHAANWIELYASDDGGGTWEYMGRPVASTGVGGNPPTLHHLPDGRLCLTYGYRDRPSGIRARLSPDGGLNWEEEIILRDDGGDHDLGYPRTAPLSGGRLITVYYFNDDPNGERHIAATIWRP